MDLRSPGTKSTGAARRAKNQEVPNYEVFQAMSKTSQVIDIESKCVVGYKKYGFRLVKDLLVSVKMAVFSQQTQNPEGEFQRFKHEFWSLTENNRTKVVDVLVNEISKEHVYDTIKVVF